MKVLRTTTCLFLILSTVLVISCVTAGFEGGDEEWTKFLYERTDIATVEVKSDFRFDMAFHDTFYRFNSLTGDIDKDQKDPGNFIGFRGQSVRVINPTKIVFGGVSSSALLPSYAIKVVGTGDNEFNTRTTILANTEEGFFLPQSDANQFLAVLKSPIRIDDTVTTNISIIRITDDLEQLNQELLFNATAKIPEEIILGATEPPSIIAAIEGDQVYYYFGTDLFRYDVGNGTLITGAPVTSYKELNFFAGELFAMRPSGFDRYNDQLNNSGTLILDAIAEFGDRKATTLGSMVHNDRLYVVVGVSDFSAKQNFQEVSVSVDLLVIDPSLNVVNHRTILEGTDNGVGLIWEQYEFMSMDIQEDVYGIFVFQNEIDDVDFEYLVRRVNLR